MTPDDLNAPANDLPVAALTETIRRSLGAIDEATASHFHLLSEAAVELLLGTALQESGGLRWREQLQGGPARGLFQMEEATYDDIWTNYLAFRPTLSDAIKHIFAPSGGTPDFSQITNDDGLAAIMARLKYYRVPAVLPSAGNQVAQAEYWKTYYNTPGGKGTVEEYLDNWQTFMA